MTRRFPILAADVWAKNIGTSEQRQALIDEAWHHRNQNDQTMGFSNRGCWRSFFKYKDIDWILNEIRDMVTQAGNHYQEHDPIYKEKTRHFLGCEIKYWTNINDQYSKNSLHEHKLYHYVAVYYLQGTGTGDIIFSNPMNLTEGCNPYAPFTSPISFSPNDGDLFVWPAWLPHETEVNLTTRNRINIAFNIRFTAPHNIEYETY